LPKTIGNIVSKLLSPIKKAWKYLDDKATVTDLLSLFIIALGMVLIIGGLTLTILDTSFGGLSSQSGFTAGTAASTINLVPGIPFFTGDLASTSLTMVGLVSWVLGIDFLLIGLGIWVRHKLADAFDFSRFVFVPVCSIYATWIYGLAKFHIGYGNVWISKLSSFFKI